MKFYSEILNKLFDTEKDLVAAEAEIEKEKAAKEAKEKERKDRLAKIKKAIGYAEDLIARYEADYNHNCEIEVPRFLFDLFKKF